MTRNPLDEAAIRALVARAQEGDTEAFGQVYDHFFESVYRYAAFRLPKELAEDVTADVFVKAWENLGGYKVHRNVPFAAWLFRIARHAVIDVYRTQRGFEEVPESLPDSDAMNRPEHRVEQQETLRIVRGALERLPRRYRDILLLSFVSDLDHAEIARVLRLTSGAVRILKMRALRKLEQLLPPELRKNA